MPVQAPEESAKARVKAKAELVTLARRLANRTGQYDVAYKRPPQSALTLALLLRRLDACMPLLARDLVRDTLDRGLRAMPTGEVPVHAQLPDHALYQIEARAALSPPVLDMLLRLPYTAC